MKLPYVVAEVGLNHSGRMDLAIRMIQEIAEAGGNAAKFQAVKADTLVAKNSPVYFQQNGNPAATQWEFFKRSDALGPDDYRALAEECQKCGIDFGCTAFTPEDVAWIDPLVKWHKVASGDITNLPLLEAVAATAKPVHLSTGASDIREVRRAIRALNGKRNEIISNVAYDRHDITLLHCVLSYPTPLAEANLGMIGEVLGGWPWLSRNDGVALAAGYSDHTLFNLDVLTTAWLLGASVIEKHYTYDKTLPGNDHFHSMDQQDLRSLVAKLKELQAMIGDGEKRVLPIEEAARKYARRGLYAARDVPAGKPLEMADIAILRPTTRWAPADIPKLLGGVSAETVKAGDPL